jgi:hypothetical protein
MREELLGDSQDRLKRGQDNQYDRTRGKMSEEMHFVDIAQHHLFYTLMLKYFAHNTSISTSNYQNVFWIRVARERNMRDHFLVAETY